MAWAVGPVARRLKAFFSRLPALIRPEALSGDVPIETAEEMQRRFMKDFMTASTRLLLRYAPRSYGGNIAIFKGKGNFGDMGQTWTGLAHGGMAEYEMPGTHLDMMEEPAVITTAALVRECLEPGRVPAGETFKNASTFEEHVVETG